jgi:hypothetical protein
MSTSNFSDWVISQKLKIKANDVAESLYDKWQSDEDRISQVEIRLKALERQFAQSKK